MQPSEQEAFLAGACGADTALRAEVAQALEAAANDIRRSSSFDTPTADSAAPADARAAVIREGPGTRIGPYKILQNIGDGGFGTVFMAEQERPVVRKVALKIIKLGMDTREVVARFEQERQALAILNHPNIAKVFDAGATESGRPYFAMELCAGDPIDVYCDRNSLGIAARLELFAQVCRAVQHAHTKGLIHRDIKPSNILVSTQDGQPLAKVIDFGIAKATAAKLTERTLFTEHRQLIGTPEYMSPEQAEGSLDIDTRTDVYSLGVLLYELLTGSTPFISRDLRSVAYAEIQRIIREVDPPKPSTRLSQNTDTIASVAACRQTEPKKLGVIVRGELDWIVMKALEKDRTRRYESSSSLAADVLRYLNGEAVVAAPPGTVYRCRKFIRRHKSGVIAASLVTLALVLGIVGTTASLLNAQQQRRIAVNAQEAESRQRALAEERLQESEATVQFLDDMLAAADPLAFGKDVTVRSVLDRAAGNLQKQYTDRPLVAARLHGTLARTYFGLGEYNPAESHARSTLETYRRELGDDDPATRQAVNSLAAVLTKKARFDEAEPMLTEAMDSNTRRFGRDHEITSQTIDGLTQLYASMERNAEAIPLAEELLRIRTSTLGEDRIETLVAMNTLATLYSSSDRFDDAEALYTKAISISTRALGPEHPLSLEMRGNFGLALYHDATTHESTNRDRFTTKLANARAIDEDVLAARTRILGEEHPSTLIVMNNLASVYKKLGMYDEADELAVKDIEISIRVLGEHHPDTVVSFANMGNSLRSRERCDEAIAYLDRALRGARISHPIDFPGTAFILGWYGSCLRDLGRFAEAEAMQLEALGIAERALGESHGVTYQMRLGLALLYDAWAQSEPDAGYDAKAAEWRARLDVGET